MPYTSPQEDARKAEWFEAMRREFAKSSDINANDDITEYYVVDFGSGYTRANLVSLSADGTQASSTKVANLHGMALQEALLDPVSRENLITQIADALPNGNILAGGTEGVRYALDTGAITQEDLDAFARSFTQRLGNRAKFYVLTKEQEAKAEWKSVEFALRNMDRLNAPDLEGLPKSADINGMVSCGGISCQVAMKTTTGAEDTQDWSFISFRNMIGKLEERLDALAYDAETRNQRTSQIARAPAVQMSHKPDSLKHELEKFRQDVGRNIAATKKSGLKGVYVLTELWHMLSYKSTEGPEFRPYQTYTVEEVRTKLDEYLKEALANDAPLSQRKRISIIMAVVGQVVFEEIFDHSAKVCFMGGKDMTWSIGWALEHRLGLLSQTA
jgi:hypothetical protein